MALTDADFSSYRNQMLGARDQQGMLNNLAIHLDEEIQGPLATDIQIRGDVAEEAITDGALHARGLRQEIQDGFRLLRTQLIQRLNVTPEMADMAVEHVMQNHATKALARAKFQV